MRLWVDSLAAAALNLYHVVSIGLWKFISLIVFGILVDTSIPITIK